MEIKLFKGNEGKTRKISQTYSVTNFLTHGDSANISLAVSNAEKHSETTSNLKSDRAYFVLDGLLSIEKDGKKFLAGPGDVLFVQKNTEYTFSGTFRAVLVNSPAFDPSAERIRRM